MKALLITLAISSLFLFSCKDDEVKNDFALNDTISIKASQTLSNEKLDISVTFDSLNDSRCPTAADCIWPGNASCSFTLTKNGIKSSFTLNTWIAPRDTVIDNYCIKLVGLTPYPEVEKTVNITDYIAKVIITQAPCDCVKNDTVIACFSSEQAYINTDSTAPPAPLMESLKFYNCSKNATHYLWDFGDGTSSTEAEPIHRYTYAATYFNTTLIASNGEDKDTITQQVYPIFYIAMKPNIYIYPTSTIDLCVHINFPKGGAVTKSIPDYNKGWCVKITPSGLIDGQYNYLFYESAQPKLLQHNNGWCIAKANLKSFFENNMAAYNFSTQEINDFTEFWIPRLNNSEYYLLYPQTNKELDPIIQLNFSVQPDHINRLFYDIVASDQAVTLPSATIIPYNRSGYTVMEWGVWLD